MLLLAIAGGILVAAALVIREWQTQTYLRISEFQQEKLQEDLDQTREDLQNTLEDLYVLRTVLAQEGIVDEFQLAQARAQLIAASPAQNGSLSGELLLSDTEVGEVGENLPLMTDSNDKLH